MIESGTSRTVAHGQTPLTTDTRRPQYSAELLTSFERCPRSGFWSQAWAKHRLSPVHMLHEAVRRALTEPHADPGENAGEHFMTLASDRGLDIGNSVNVYRCAMNHAAITDIVVTAIRQNSDSWKPANCIQGWNLWKPSCLMAGDGVLRRFLAVSHWSEDRELFERRSWFCLGEVAHYRLPMQMVVANIGHMSGGRRTGPFSKALLHPQRSHIRFKRRTRHTIEGFKETYTPIYREEHDEINREKWLQAMLDDGVLQESLFVINIPVPPEPECRRICDLASRQIEKLQRLTELPDRQLSTCFDPISKCSFVCCCHNAENDDILPSTLSGFDKIS